MKSDFDEHSAADLVVGDVLAFRAFRIDRATETLGGLSYHQEIAPGVNVAQCAYHLNDARHSVPHGGCTCGWYAYDEFRYWGSGGSQAGHHRPRPMRASGIVRLSGRVIICERGLKAENMEVIALTVHSDDESLVRQMFPNVELFDDEGKMITAYPLSRLDREESEDGSHHNRGTKLTSWFTRKGPIATFAVNKWNALTAQATASEIIRWAVVRLFLLGLGFTVLYSISDTANIVYPEGSVDGFGPLIPLGILILLSPIMNLWRSAFGLLTYLLVLNYGLVNSGETVEPLLRSAGITDTQLAVAVLTLYLVPGILLLMRVVSLVSRIREAAVPPPQLPTGAAIIGSGGLARAAPRMGLAFQQNRLPKKIKPTSTDGRGQNEHDSGGHNG